MIAILGGTFDPVHLGHLALAEHATLALNPDTVLFMPCKQPVHKANTMTAADHRIKMLELAIKSYPLFKVDLSEINRPTASYTLETLDSLSQRFSEQPIFFLIGMDSLNSFHTWYQWQACLTKANFLVFQRPGEPFNPDPQVKEFIVGDIAHYFEKPSNSGSIYLIEHQQVAISSSDLRANIHQLSDKYLPYPVASYIKQHRLYQ